MKRHILAPVVSRKPVRMKFPSFVGDSDGVLGEGDRAIRVAEYAHAEEVVDEGWHDVATGSSWRQVQ